MLGGSGISGGGVIGGSGIGGGGVIGGSSICGSGVVGGASTAGLLGGKDGGSIGVAGTISRNASFVSETAATRPASMPMPNNASL